MGEKSPGQSFESDKEQYQRLFEQVQQELDIFTDLIPKSREANNPLYNVLLYREANDTLSTARHWEVRGDYKRAAEIMTTALNKLRSAKTPPSRNT